MSGLPEGIVLSVRLVEALIFTAAEPVTQRVVAELLSRGLLDEGQDAGAPARAVIARLCRDCSGRGVELVPVGGGGSSVPPPTWRRCRCA